MARVKNGCQSYARLQVGYQYAVHFVVDNVTRGPEVDRVDDLVVTVVLVTIKILCLSTVPCLGQINAYMRG